MKAELVVDAKAILGEGPGWDADKKELYWVDIEGKCIHVYNPDRDVDRTIDVGQRIGAVVQAADGGWIAAMQNGFYRIHRDGGEPQPIADPEADKPNNRFNDGKCDRTGRLWAGTMGLNSEREVGALYTLETDGQVKKKLNDISISNGLSWSLDGQTMYYIDSPTKNVFAFDYEMETGEISNRRVIVTIADNEGIPDGMTIDAEGMIWVAHFGGWKVSRFDPASGDRIGVVEVPAERVTSCCFGGDSLDELYITTARVSLTESDLANQPHAGGLFRVKTDVKGTPTYKYGA